MPKTSNQEFPIHVPMDRYYDFLGLGERGFLTLTFLSKLVMLAILPGTKQLERENAFENEENGFLSYRSFPNIRSNAGYYAKIPATHTLRSLSVDGLETLEAKQTEQDPNQQYQILYCGNSQDALEWANISSHIRSEPNNNYIFWNYPGVGFSLGAADSTHKLFKAGYQQAKRLIDQGIPSQNITLHGFSLGGSVATHVARQLHEEGHLVNLKIDRSFARISIVASTWIKNNMGNVAVYMSGSYNGREIVTKKNINSTQLKYLKSDTEENGTMFSICSSAITDFENAHTSTQTYYAPLITSIIALAMSGVTLGTSLAGFVASIGLVLASSIATIGYIGAHFIQKFGFVLQEITNLIGDMIAFPFSFFSESISDDIKSLFYNIGCFLVYSFNLASFATSEVFSIMSSFLDNAVNLIGSIVGGVIAISGLVSGSILGLVLGALLSIQLFWTEKPLTMPMTPAFSAALYSLCCEMDSVSEIHRLLKADIKPANRAKIQSKISVTNVIDDEVIDVNASLSMGLGLKPGKPSDDESRPLKGKIASFWYRSGGHCGKLDELVDSNLPFCQ